MDLDVITIDEIDVSLVSSVLDDQKVPDDNHLIKDLLKFYHSLKSGDSSECLLPQNEISSNKNSVQKCRPPTEFLTSTPKKGLLDHLTTNTNPAAIDNSVLKQSEVKEKQNEHKLINNVQEQVKNKDDCIIILENVKKPKSSIVQKQIAPKIKDKVIPDKENQTSLIKTNEKPSSVDVNNNTNVPKTQNCFDKGNFSAQENADIVNPDWTYLKNLKTDAARYKAVRLAWENTDVPDPNVNLSLFNYRKSNAADLKTTNSRKRKPLNQLHPNYHPKRRKNFNNVSFYDQAVHNAREHVLHSFEFQYNGATKEPAIRYIEKRFGEKLTQLDSLHHEVNSLLTFYRGLPDQKQHSQQEIEDEQYDIESVYDSFADHYRWSQTEFHAI